MTTPTNGPVVVPSAHQPAPKAPAAPAPAPAAPAAPSPEAARIAELEQRLAAADKKLRVNGVEVMKVASEKKAMGAKLSEHSRYEKAFKAAGLTPDDLEAFKAAPARVFQKAFGEKWRDAVAEAMVNPDSVNAEFVTTALSQTKEQIREEIRRENEEREQAAAKARQDADAAAREQITGEAVSFLEKSGSEYPIFDGYEKSAVAKAIAQHIEQQYLRTGKVMTMKEAADALETAEVSRAERLAGIEKYKGRLTEKLKPATVVAKSEGQVSRGAEAERRTLSNDLTATSPAKRTHRTDEERRAAIMALNLDRGT